jgi:hypothetical protein
LKTGKGIEWGFYFVVWHASVTALGYQSVFEVKCLGGRPKGSVDRNNIPLAGTYVYDKPDSQSPSKEGTTDICAIWSV